MQTPTSRSLTRRRWTRFLGTGATALVAATALASTAGAATTSNAPAGATGSVAALNASSMEVQNPASGQTTVNWTSTTQFSKTVSEAVSSLSTGDCVSVTGTQSKKSKTTIAARSITVSTPAAGGSCTRPGARATTGGAAGGAGGGFQFRGGGSGFGGSGGTRPSFPSGGSGASNFRKQLASLAIASGKVTAVNGSTVTVSGINVSAGSFRRPTSKSGSKSAKKPALPKTQTLKITTSSSTTLNATQSVEASALAVGECVSAFGPAASTGAVTATTVRISMPSGGSCTGGFGRFGGGGGFGGGPGGPGGSGA